MKSLADERAAVLLSAAGLRASDRSLPKRLRTQLTGHTTFDRLGAALVDLNQAAVVDTEEPYHTYRLVIECYRATLHVLFEDAQRASEAVDYWRTLENEAFSATVYLVQTGPQRLLSLLRGVVHRIQERHSRQKYHLRQLISPSLIVGSLFPYSVKLCSSSVLDDGHLHLRSLLQPLFFVRKEVERKRRELQRNLQCIEQRIGILCIATTSNHVNTAEDICNAVGQVAVRMYNALGVSIAEPMHYTPEHAGELRGVLNHVLAQQQAYRDSMEAVFLANAPPSRLARAWPIVFLGPPALYWMTTRLLKQRETFRRWFIGIRDTVRSFVSDWLLEPCLKILDTVRHGDDTLAIMGKQSLSSDLNSLERMVADFSRDQKEYTEAQIETIAHRVREGDLTPVLRVWETDIKTPVRSAVTGSLLRTLLIQVQKVKVDLALAMHGVEKMLRSQQLTFAFVGVAPSILIVIGAKRLLYSLFATGGTRIARSRASRRYAWSVMRTVDLLVQPGTNFSNDLPEGQTNMGRLLVQAALLRDFAHDRDSLLSRDRALRADFLDDVRNLENAENKQWAAERLWKCWEGVLRW